MIDATKATKNIATLRQPSGTNHFQFRVHQFGFEDETAGGAWSIDASMSDEKSLATQLFACHLPRHAGRMLAYEIKTVSPLFIYSCVNRAAGCVCHDPFRSGRARWHMDEFTRDRVDNQS